MIEDSYYNMREKVVEHSHILDIAQQAMRDCHITPEMKPIRGGTDGAQLSFMGLPCPNLFTGGYNYHGKHEFVTLEDGKSGTGDCAYRGADGEARPVANVTHCGEAFYYLWRDIFRHKFSASSAEYTPSGPSASNNLQHVL